MLVQFHVFVHSRDALLESGLEGRNLVSDFVFLSLLRFRMAQRLLQLPDAFLGFFAVLSELFDFSPSLQSLLILA